ncbi:2-phospho-L-lactate guanylyltransferase [Pusillimonas sp.]|uniref:2-phospho-L-lactate guanylyltransferase n=1 Tax=Pusillimonas sp. TaxID=3040095 RepID=UPI0037C96B3B
MQRIAAVIPVKSFNEAKQRLKTVLSHEERRRLARVMFEDVLSVLIQCERLAAVYVVTSDREAAHLAISLGASTLPDPVSGGLSGAVAAAAQTLRSQGMEGMMVVPSDVPAIDPATVNHLLDAHALPRAVTLVPAARDGGTNAMLCSPPNVIPNCFGHNSFRAHRHLATSSGIEPNILSTPRLHYDIDRPLDLLSFLNCSSSTKTYAYLKRSGIAARLLNAAVFPATESIFPRAVPELIPTRFQKG